MHSTLFKIRIGRPSNPTPRPQNKPTNSIVLFMAYLVSPAGVIEVTLKLLLFPPKVSLSQARQNLATETADPTGLIKFGNVVLYIDSQRVC